MLDKDLLDPTVDIPDYLQATFEKIAQQRGGRNDRVQQYNTLARMGKTPADVMAESYDEQERRNNEQLAAAMPTQDIRRDPNFFMDGHLYDVPQTTETGGFDTRDPMATDPSMPETGGYDMRGEDPSAMPDFGGGATGGASLGVSGGQQDVPIVDPAQIDTSRLEEIQNQINSLLNKPQQGFTPSPMPAPDSASAILTGLAMLFAPRNQAGNILQALANNQDAIRMRNDVLAKLHAQTQNEAEKRQLEALLKKAAMEETRAYRTAYLQNQANIANANNQRSIQNNQNTQNAITSRQERKLGAEMQKLRARFDHEDNAKGQALLSEFEARKKIVRAAYPEISDDQVEEKAAKYVNAQAEGQVLKNQGIVLDNTYKQKTLVTRIGQEEQKLKNLKYTGAYTQARTKYTKELTKYLPMNEALKWAALYALWEYRDREMNFKENQADSKGYSDAVETDQTAYEAAVDSHDNLARAIRLGMNEDGSEMTPEQKANNERLLKFFEDTATAAKKKLEESQGAADRAAQARREFAKEKPRLFGKGKRPAPIGGKVPKRQGDEAPEFGNPGFSPANPEFQVTPEQLPEPIRQLLEGGKPSANIDLGPFAEVV